MLIVTSADEAFAPHAATLMHSVAVHNPGVQFRLLSAGLTRETLATIEAFAAALAIDFAVVPVDEGVFAGATLGMWPPATYARLMIPDVFPDHMRALYIDADCIVTGPLGTLWDTDLSSAALAGVSDPLGCVQERERGFAAGEDYVNAGVLLLNLLVWRRERIADAALAFARQHSVIYADQSAINAVTEGRRILVATGWNFMIQTFAKRTADIHVSSLPGILHYCGAKKPWRFCDYPLGAIYDFHRAKTPFPMPRRRWRRAPLLRLAGKLRRSRFYRDLTANEARLRVTLIEPYIAQIPTTSVQR